MLMPDVQSSRSVTRMHKGFSTVFGGFSEGLNMVLTRSSGSQPRAFTDSKMGTGTHHIAGCVQIQMTACRPASVVDVENTLGKPVIFWICGFIFDLVVLFLVFWSEHGNN